LALGGFPVVLALEVSTPWWPANGSVEIRRLIREMSIANPLWGAPRIHRELLKFGIDIGQTSVAKYLARRKGSPRLRSMGIRDRPTSPRSPWQNAYAERLIGSIRRECFGHVAVFGERHLRHVLLSYMNYYNEVRTYRWVRMHRHRAVFTEPGIFLAVRSWADCITNMFGFDLRQAQAFMSNCRLRRDLDSGRFQCS
jgi:hypothetical protein